MFFVLGAGAFIEKFCPGAGLLTTSKKFPGGLRWGGGLCWYLELTDALKGNVRRQNFTVQH